MKGNPEERQTEIPVPSPSSPNRHNHDTHPTVGGDHWLLSSLVEELIGGLNKGQSETTIRSSIWNRTTIPEPAAQLRHGVLGFIELNAVIESRESRRAAARRRSARCASCCTGRRQRVGMLSTG